MAFILRLEILEVFWCWRGLHRQPVGYRFVEFITASMSAHEWEHELVKTKRLEAWENDLKCCHFLSNEKDFLTGMDRICDGINNRLALSRARRTLKSNVLIVGDFQQWDELRGVSIKNDMWNKALPHAWFYIFFREIWWSCTGGRTLANHQLWNNRKLRKVRLLRVKVVVKFYALEGVDPERCLSLDTPLHILRL